MSERLSLPLFPLGVVLFPDMPLPLHIFEERYKLMIGECIQAEKPFGVVYYTGENFYRVGCTGMIRKVVETFDDGRMNILAEGVERFIIHQIDSTRPYLLGQVEMADDVEEEHPAELKDLAAAAAALYKEILPTPARDKRMELVEQLTPKTLSFLIAASAGFSLNEKQAFLEMFSTAERLRKATSAMRRMSERQRTTKEIEGIISGNGYIHNKPF
ncbi:MAG: LON peptidase substrate-binding domain-containing protein [Bacteroidetes bacterium]|nr:LON peptidase substrate-binding domain-containing protein [Bacteroidota bacterium]